MVSNDRKIEYEPKIKTLWFETDYIKRLFAKSFWINQNVHSVNDKTNCCFLKIFENMKWFVSDLRLNSIFCRCQTKDCKNDIWRCFSLNALHMLKRRGCYEHLHITSVKNSSSAKAPQNHTFRFIPFWLVRDIFWWRFPNSIFYFLMQNSRERCFFFSFFPFFFEKKKFSKFSMLSLRVPEY